MGYERRELVQKCDSDIADCFPFKNISNPILERLRNASCEQYPLRSLTQAGAMLRLAQTPTPVSFHTKSDAMPGRNLKATQCGCVIDHTEALNRR